MLIFCLILDIPEGDIALVVQKEDEICHACLGVVAGVQFIRELVSEFRGNAGDFGMTVDTEPCGGTEFVQFYRNELPPGMLLEQGFPDGAVEPGHKQ